MGKLTKILSGVILVFVTNRKIVSLLGLILLINLFSGCGGENHNAHYLINPKATKHASLVAGSQPMVKPRKVVLVIDGSKSMLGYVAHSNNNEFYNLIQNIIQNLPTDIPIDIYKLDASLNKVDGNLSQQLDKITSKEFYDGSSTNIPALLQNKSIVNENTLIVFLSDWVNSLGGKSGNTMVMFTRDLRDLIVNKDGMFGILGKRVYFDGLYYSQSQPNYVFPVQGDRPLFGIVIGPSKFYRFSTETIENNWEVKFFAGNPSVATLRYDIEGQSSDEEGNDRIIPSQESEFEIDSILGATVQVLSIKDSDTSFMLFHTKDTEREQELGVELKVFQPSFDDNGNLVQTGEYVSGERPKISYLSKNKDSLLIKIDPNCFRVGENYAFIHLTSSLPHWVVEWSSNSDNIPNSVTKVYQLDRWVNEFLLKDLPIEKKSLATTLFVIKK